MAHDGKLPKLSQCRAADRAAVSAIRMAGSFECVSSNVCHDPPSVSPPVWIWRLKGGSPCLTQASAPSACFRWPPPSLTLQARNGVSAAMLRNFTHVGVPNKTR